MGRGLHMIIYYHCTSDNPLLLSFFTNLPSLHPLSFHEMIFIPGVKLAEKATITFNFMFVALYMYIHTVPQHYTIISV